MPLMAMIRMPKVRALQRALNASKCAPELRVTGKARKATGTATSPIGTLTANSQGQLATDRIAEATVGPTADAIEPIVAAHPNERVACVAHGGVLDCVYRFANGLPLDAPRNYALLNTSVNVVDFEDGRATVVSWADIAHLDGRSEDDSIKKTPEHGR